MGEPSTSQGSLKPWQALFGKIYSLHQHQELENYFRSDPYPAQKAIEGLAASLDLKEDQVQKWFQKRQTAYLRLGLRPIRGRQRPRTVGFFSHHGQVEEEPPNQGPITGFAWTLEVDFHDGDLLQPCWDLGDITQEDTARPQGSHGPEDEAAPTGQPKALEAFHSLSVSDTTL